MTQVEVVALWTGLIGSIVSTVLSVVAIIFAIVVDRSSRAVTAQTIKSLQKIETEVERLSGDTRELIKAGWDKMLCGLSSVDSAQVVEENKDVTAKEIAAGVAAELRAEIAAIPEKLKNDDLNAILDKLQTTLAAQLRTDVSHQSPASAIDEAYKVVSLLQSEARSLATAIAKRNGHLNDKEYLNLTEGSLRDALVELRTAGILVPLRAADGKPVYFFPPKRASTYRIALSLLSPVDKEVSDQVYAELRRIGYLKEE